MVVVVVFLMVVRFLVVVPGFSNGGSIMSFVTVCRFGLCYVVGGGKCYGVSCVCNWPGSPRLAHRAGVAGVRPDHRLVSV